ncbi:hypothetical protein [Natrarchaeobius oligotrophus]|uniref:hypothetical protein n=1 Tax=Natrarchaeobius oligotrophus TaxID=3455743 RepID=UPI001FB364CB|nr:hypothetical protein [Natrarchaeobius chitinivorans]
MEVTACGIRAVAFGRCEHEHVSDAGDFVRDVRSRSDTSLCVVKEVAFKIANGCPLVVILSSLVTVRTPPRGLKTFVRETLSVMFDEMVLHRVSDLPPVPRPDGELTALASPIVYHAALFVVVD